MWEQNWAAPESNFNEIWFKKAPKIGTGFFILKLWAPLFWLPYSHMPPKRFFKDVSSKITVFASSGGPKLLSKINKKHAAACVFQNLFVQHEFWRMSLAKTPLLAPMWDQNWSQNCADSFKLQASLLETKTSAENKKLRFYKRRFQLKIRNFALTKQVFNVTFKD